MTTAFGKYELLERIAVGGMAEVFRARVVGEGGFEKHLVIKRILPHLSRDAEFVRMLIDEARIAGQLYHPNIIQIYDLGKIDGTYFIAMEFIEGGDLKVVLKRCRDHQRPMPIAHAVFVAGEVLKGLDYAHQKTVPGRTSNVHLQIIHRDISPPNILLSYEGEAKIVDFGIAKAAVRVMETSAGILKGKFEYMSPEQASGMTLDSRTDLFSTGILLYEMLTGVNPFTGQTDMQVLTQVRSARYTPPTRIRPEVPERLEQIIARALSRDPEDRYQRAADMRADLTAFAFETGNISNASRLSAFMRALFEEELRAGTVARAEDPPPSPEGPFMERDSDLDTEADLATVHLTPAASPSPAPALPRPNLAPPAAAPVTSMLYPERLPGDIPTRAAPIPPLDRPLQPDPEPSQSFSLSTQSAVALLQAHLQEAEASMPHAFPMPPQGPAPVSMLNPPPEADARPVDLRFGFDDDDDIATTIQEMPTRESVAAAAKSVERPNLASMTATELGAPSGSALQGDLWSAPGPGFAPEMPSAAPYESPSVYDPSEPAPYDQASNAAFESWSVPSPSDASRGMELDLPAPEQQRYLEEPIPWNPPMPPAPLGDRPTQMRPMESLEFDGGFPGGSFASDSGFPSGAVPTDRATVLGVLPSATPPTSAAAAAAPALPTLSVRGISKAAGTQWKPYGIGAAGGLIIGLILATALGGGGSAPEVAAEAPAPASSGQPVLTIQTEGGAEAFLNNNPVGSQFPLKIPVAAQRDNHIRLVKEGMKDFETVVRLNPGETMLLAVPILQPIPRPVEAAEEADETP